jgi:hypothetical protein
MKAKVIVDRARRSAILYDQTETHLKAIRMSEGELTTCKMYEDELTADWFELVDYKPEKAAAIYLQHLGGVSAKAREVLNQVIDDAFFGEEVPNATG